MNRKFPEDRRPPERSRFLGAANDLAFIKSAFEQVP